MKSKNAFKKLNTINNNKMESEIYYEIVKLDDYRDCLEYFVYLTLKDENSALKYLFDLYKNEYITTNNFNHHSRIMRHFGYRKCVKINDEVFKTQIYHFSFEQLVKKFNWTDQYTQNYFAYKSKIISKN